nr:MAG TPA: hypothetical protein [Caudoviricetes sp.]
MKDSYCSDTHSFLRTYNLKGPKTHQRSKCSVW